MMDEGVKGASTATSRLSSNRPYIAVISLVVSLVSLGVSISSYRDTTSLRYKLGGEVPWAEQISIVNAKPLLWPDPLRSLLPDTYKTALPLRLSIINNGARPFSVHDVDTSIVRPYKPDEAKNSLWGEPIPYTAIVHTKVFGKGGQPIRLPLSVPAGDELLITLRIHYPIPIVIAKKLFKHGETAYVGDLCQLFPHKMNPDGQERGTTQLDEYGVAVYVNISHSRHPFPSPRCT